MLYEEFITWEVLPFLRRKLSIYFVKEIGLKQKVTAKYLRLTEGAVSQYLKGKRGNLSDFDNVKISKFSKRINKIYYDNHNVNIVLKEIIDDTKRFKIIFNKKYGGK